MMPDEFDNTQAVAEGWGIYDCSGSENGQWQMQRDDEADTFADDSDVWRFVSERAANGSDYHQAALAWLKDHCPFEFECIERAVAGLSRPDRPLACSEGTCKCRNWQRSISDGGNDAVHSR